MKSSNIEEFNLLVDEYLKQDSRYERQIRNFQSFLKEYGLEDKVFNLYEDNINDFFEYAVEHNIGTDAQLSIHIAALKGLFSFLIDNNRKFSELNGYISTASFRERLSNKVDRTVSKKFISEELLQKILVTIDEYIEYNSGLEAKGNHEESFYLDVIIARLFIKLSLLLPLQTGQIIDIKLGDVRSTQFREIIHNDVKVKLPNNLRKDIINSVNYAEMKYRVKYSTEDKIFEYLYSCENKKGQREGINRTLPRVYEGLGLVEMLEKVSGGKRDKYIYPAGSYKKTAIYNMLNNGANIVYLEKLTGLDTKTLLSDFVFDNLNERDIETNINSSLLQCEYYEYL